MSTPTPAQEWVRHAMSKPEMAALDVPGMIGKTPHDYAALIGRMADEAVAAHAPETVVHDLRLWHKQTAAGVQRLAAHPYLRSVIDSVGGVTTNEQALSLLHAAIEKAPTAADKLALQIASHQFSPSLPAPPSAQGFGLHACAFCGVLGAEFGPVGILAGCLLCGVAAG